MSQDTVSEEELALTEALSSTRKDTRGEALKKEGEEFPTSLGAPSTDDLSPSRLKKREEDRRNNKSLLSKMSRTMEESASSHTPWTMLFKQPGVFFKVLSWYITYKVARKFIDWRNRPSKFLKHPDKKLKRIAEPVNFEDETRDDLVTILRKLRASLTATKHGEKLGRGALSWGGIEG